MARIAIDNRLAYHRPAGIARYTRNLVRALQGLAPADSFIEWRHRRQAKARFGAPNWRSRLLVSPVHHAWEQRMLQFEMLRFRVDVAHFPDFISPYLSPQKSVITVHDLAFHHWPELVTADAKAYYDQLPRAVAHAAAVITPCQFTCDDLLAQVPHAKGKVHVIPSGIDPLFLQPGSPYHDGPMASTDLPPAYLLHVGTLEPRKNIPTLLKALKILKQDRRHANLHLVLAGAQGWHDEGIYRLVRDLDLERACIFPGYLSDAALRQTYRQALCLVHPALYEGFGFTLLESMACGTPVVASNAACLPEIAGDAALYANPAAAEEMTARIRDVLQDEELRRTQIERGKAQVAQFRWEDSAAATLATYHAVLA